MFTYDAWRKAYNVLVGVLVVITVISYFMFREFVVWLGVGLFLVVFFKKQIKDFLVR